MTRENVKELIIEIGGKMLFFTIFCLVLFLIGKVVIEKSISNKIDKLKDLENAFNQEKNLFCNGQIVTIKAGWVLDGTLLKKDDRYYYIDDCFIKGKQ